MITSLSISGDNIYQEDIGDGCVKFKIRADTSKIEEDGWRSNEYKVVYTFYEPIANGIPQYAYTEEVAITILDELGEYIDNRVVWVNFVSLI